MLDKSNRKETAKDLKNMIGMDLTMDQLPEANCVRLCGHALCR